jgi:two-component system CheB/CheR fusion protein
VFDQPLMSLDIGLPLQEVRTLVRDTLGDSRDVHEAVVTATNRRGRTIACRIVAGVSGHTGPGGPDVVLLMEELKG